MQNWYTENIKPHCSGLQGHLKRWEASFAQASSDSIKVLAMRRRKGYGKKDGAISNNI